MYGSTETGHLLMESSGNQLLPSTETAYLEVLDTDAAGVGELVVTTLSNDYMPLIRYRIGDLVERWKITGRTHYRVHGRRRDALHARTGRRVTTWQVDQCFAAVAGVVHYQLKAREDGSWQLRYVPEGEGPTAGELAELRARLEDLLAAPGAVTTAATDLLVPTKSGKFRLTQAG
jgi:phenylacetate-CoA ligase